MALVPDWRQTWRYYSQQAMAAAAAIQAAWVALPADLQASIPGWAVTGLTIATLVLGIIGRVVDQGSGNAGPPR